MLYVHFICKTAWQKSQITIYYIIGQKVILASETEKKPSENWRDETAQSGLFDIASRESFSPDFYTASGGEPMKTN